MMAYSTSNKWGSGDDRARFVREQLSMISGVKRDLGSKFQICCPYHNDSNPSALIGLDPAETRGPVGWFTCLGCGKSVGWNEVARTLGLKPLSKPKDLKAEHFSEPKTHKAELFGKKKDRAEFSELQELRIEKPFPFKKWRGVDVQLLYAVGAQYAIHTGWNDMPFVLLPVNVNGKMRGYVKAKIEKPTDGKPSYLNAKADNDVNWSRMWGLIYFDYSIQLMRDRKLKTMVLCEGPRDSLRYLSRDIPAVSVLGALNWTAHKRDLLVDAGVEKLVISFDGDDAGIKATKAVYKDVKHHFDTKYLALWKERRPRIENIPPSTKHIRQAFKMQGDKKIYLWDNEMDPFNMPERFVDSVEKELV